jgi:DNA invertase Pin-like site-specific DNA recombinase
MKAIYIRISTPSQSVETQLKKDSPELKPFIDVCSGSVPFESRKYGKKLMSSKSITSIQVREVSRLGRNLKDILNTIEYFTAKGVNIFIENQRLHTLLENGNVNPSAQLIISMFGAVAQMERDLLLERTKIGVAIAQGKGLYKGRKRGAVGNIQDKNETLISALQLGFNNGLSITDISKKHNVTRQRIYSYLEKGLIRKL